MLNFYLGLIVGLSLIVALGPQNVFVIEQGIKRNFIFWVCLICTVSDVALITVGIFLFYILQNQLTEQVVLFFNFLLVVFLIFYGFTRVRLVFNQKLINANRFSSSKFKDIALKTFLLTYLNPHVYADTILYIGNISKDMLVSEKIFFGGGASLASFIFFFSIGYGAKLLSKYINSQKSWKMINGFVAIFMFSFAIKVLFYDIF